MPVFDYQLRVTADVAQAEAAIRRLRELGRSGGVAFGAGLPAGQGGPGSIGEAVRLLRTQAESLGRWQADVGRALTQLQRGTNPAGAILAGSTGSNVSSGALQQSLQGLTRQLQEHSQRITRALDLHGAAMQKHAALMTRPLGALSNQQQYVKTYNQYGVATGPDISSNIGPPTPVAYGVGGAGYQKAAALPPASHPYYGLGGYPTPWSAYLPQKTALPQVSDSSIRQLTFALREWQAIARRPPTPALQPGGGAVELYRTPNEQQQFNRALRDWFSQQSAGRATNWYHGTGANFDRFDVNPPNRRTPDPNAYVGPHFANQWDIARGVTGGDSSRMPLVGWGSGPYSPDRPRVISAQVPGPVLRYGHEYQLNRAMYQHAHERDMLPLTEYLRQFGGTSKYEDVMRYTPGDPELGSRYAGAQGTFLYHTLDDKQKRALGESFRERMRGLGYAGISYGNPVEGGRGLIGLDPGLINITHPGVGISRTTRDSFGVRSGGNARFDDIWNRPEPWMGDFSSKAYSWLAQHGLRGYAGLGGPQQQRRELLAKNPTADILSQIDNVLAGNQGIVPVDWTARRAFGVGPHDEGWTTLADQHLGLSGHRRPGQAYLDQVEEFQRPISTSAELEQTLSYADRYDQRGPSYAEAYNSDVENIHRPNGPEPGDLSLMSDAEYRDHVLHSSLTPAQERQALAGDHRRASDGRGGLRNEPRGVYEAREIYKRAIRAPDSNLAEFRGHLSDALDDTGFTSDPYLYPPGSITSALTNPLPHEVQASQAALIDQIDHLTRPYTTGGAVRNAQLGASTYPGLFPASQKRLELLRKNLPAIRGGSDEGNEPPHWAKPGNPHYEDLARQIEEAMQRADSPPALHVGKFEPNDFFRPFYLRSIIESSGHGGRQGHQGPLTRPGDVPYPEEPLEVSGPRPGPEQYGVTPASAASYWAMRAADEAGYAGSLGGSQRPPGWGPDELEKTQHEIREQNRLMGARWHDHARGRSDAYNSYQEQLAGFARGNDLPIAAKAQAAYWGMNLEQLPQLLGQAPSARSLLSGPSGRGVLDILNGQNISAGFAQLGLTTGYIDPKILHPGGQRAWEHERDNLPPNLSRSLRYGNTGGGFSGLSRQIPWDELPLSRPPPNTGEGSQYKDWHSFDVTEAEVEKFRQYRAQQYALSQGATPEVAARSGEYKRLRTKPFKSFDAGWEDYFDPSIHAHGAELHTLRGAIEPALLEDLMRQATIEAGGPSFLQESPTGSYTGALERGITEEHLTDWADAPHVRREHDDKYRAGVRSVYQDSIRNLHRGYYYPPEEVDEFRADLGAASQEHLLGAPYYGLNSEWQNFEAQNGLSFGYGGAVARQGYGGLQQRGLLNRSIYNPYPRALGPGPSSAREQLALSAGRIRALPTLAIGPAYGPPIPVPPGGFAAETGKFGFSDRAAGDLTNQERRKLGAAMAKEAAASQRDAEAAEELAAQRRQLIANAKREQLPPGGAGSGGGGGRGGGGDNLPVPYAGDGGEGGGRRKTSWEDFGGNSGGHRFGDIAGFSAVAYQQEYAEATSAAAQAKQAAAAAQNAANARASVANEEYITYTAAAGKASQLTAEKIRARALGLERQGGPQFADNREGEMQRRAAIAVAERVQQEREKVAVNKRLLSEMQREASTAGSLVKIEIERLTTEREVRAAENRIKREAIQQGIASGQLGQGTLFQRFQASLHSRGDNATPRAPEDESKLGQFVGQKFATTAGFFLSGAVLYGGISQIRELLKYSEELQRVFSTIKAQFASLGESSGFANFRSGILGIARDTGTTASQVATVGFQLKGAFGDSPQALKETSAAIKLAAVTGLELTEVTDSLTATALTFNTSIEAIGDNALGLQERFGVLAKETIKFTADLAPVAKEAGFNEQQLSALGAVAQQVSGRSGGALAEQFGRVIPGLQSKGTDLLGLYQQTPELQGRQSILETAVAHGNMADVFKILLEDYPKLSKGQKNYVNELLGGRREAGAVITTLQNGRRVLAEWGRSGQEDVGKTSKYFQELHDTVSNTMQRLAESFKQAGEALFRSGLGDILRDIGSVLGGILSSVGQFLGLIGELNGATQGWALRIVEVIALYKLLQIGMHALSGSEAAGGAAGLISRVLPGRGKDSSKLTTVLQGVGAGPTEAAEAAAASKVAAQRAASTAVGRQQAASEFGVSPTVGQRVRGAAAGLRGAVGRTAAPYSQAFGAAGTAASTGSLTGVGAALLPVAPGLLTAGFVAYSAYETLKSQAESKADQLAGKYQKYNSDHLKDLAKAREGIFSRIYKSAFGVDTNDAIARQELRVRSGAGYADQAEALSKLDLPILKQVTKPRDQPPGWGAKDWFGLKRVGWAAKSEVDDISSGKVVPDSLLPEDEIDVLRDRVKFNDLADKLREGDPDAIKRFRKIMADLEKAKKTHPKQANEIQSAIDSAKDASGQNGPVEQTLKTLEEQRQLFEAGGESGTDYSQALQGSIGTLDRLKEQGDADKNRALQLAKLRKEWSNLQAQFAQETYQGVLANLNITGGDSEQKLAAALDLLRDPRIATNPEARAQAIQQVDQAHQAVVQNRIDLARSDAEKILAQHPDTTDPTRRGEDISKQFEQTGDVGDSLRNAAKGLGWQFEDLRQYAIGEGRGNRNAYLQIESLLKTKRAALEEWKKTADNNELSGINEQMAAIDKALSGLDSALAKGQLGDVKTYAGLSGNELAKAYEEQKYGFEQQQFATNPYAANADRSRRAKDVQNQLSADEKTGMAAAQSALDLAIASGNPQQIVAAQTRYKEEKKRYATAHYAADKESLAAMQDADQLALQLTESSIDLWASQTIHRNPVDQARAAREKAQAEYKAAVQSGDPTKINTAARAQNDAAEQQHQAAEGVLQARIQAYQQIYAQNRPVAAGYAIQAAQEALKEARRVGDTGAQASAYAQLIQAQDSYWRSLTDIFVGQQDLAAAIANKAGDSVGAAQAHLAAARAQLASAQSLYNQGKADAGVLAEAQAGVVNAEASVRDADLQQKTDDVQFRLEMEQISKAQAIAIYQGYLNNSDILGLNEKQKRELMLDIKRLRDSVDMQYNLPSALGLPTLYQAQRIAQGGTQSMTDNRNINITYYAYNQADHGSNLQDFQDVVTGPAVNGTFNKRI